MNTSLLLSPPKSTSLGKVAWIDYLKGIAIIGVVIVHSSQRIYPFTPNHLAYYGSSIVQLFFMVSGFLTIRSLLFRISSEDTLTTLPSYLVNKLKRIAPIYWFFSIFYFFFYYLKGDPVDFGFLLLSLSFINSLWLPAINSYPPGSWVVANIVLFYIVSYLLVASLARLTTSVICFLLAFILTYLFYFLYAHFFGFSDASIVEFISKSGYFSFPTQLPIFLLGVVLFHIHSNQEMFQGNRIALFTLPILLASIPLAILYFLELPYKTYFSMMIAYCALFSCVALWYKSVPLKSLIEAFGRYSLEIYLVHFVIISGVFAFLNFSKIQGHCNLIFFCIPYALAFYILILILSFFAAIHVRRLF